MRRKKRGAWWLSSDHGEVCDGVSISLRLRRHLNMNSPPRSISILNSLKEFRNHHPSTHSKSFTRRAQRILRIARQCTFQTRIALPLPYLPTFGLPSRITNPSPLCAPAALRDNFHPFPSLPRAVTCYSFQRPIIDNAFLLLTTAYFRCFFPFSMKTPFPISQLLPAAIAGKTATLSRGSSR